MLKRTEDIPIILNRKPDTLERLIAQAQEPLPAHEFTLIETFTDLIEEGLARGWICSASLQEAEACVQRLLTTYPGLTVTAVKAAPPFRQEVIDRLCEGLQQAGLPE